MLFGGVLAWHAQGPGTGKKNSWTTDEALKNK